MARSTIQRRAPTRTCVACRTEREKGDLVRLVRTQNGEVRIDPTGKASGRGAYLCADPACWSKALKTRAVQRALEVTSAAGLTELLSAGPPARSRQPNRSSASGVSHGA